MAGQADDRARMRPPRKPMSSNHSQPQSAASSTFSETTKLEALRLSGPNCWSCSNLDPELAHVVSQKDGQTCFWEQAGLFPFSYKAVTNCIPLCPQCHRALDRSDDPCYVFLPSDLQFFIDWEIDDQHQRSQEILPRHRIVPGGEQYRNHQLSQDLISSDANGGLYCSYFLKDYLLGGRCSTDLLREFTGPRPWHGHPLAAIRRGIAILGSARCYVLDQNTIDQLTTLRRLYFNDPFIVDQRLSALYHVPPLAHKRKRDDDDSHDQDSNRQKRHASSVHRESQQNPPTAARPPPEEAANSRATQHGSHVDSECVFGPDTTSDDKIRHFSPLLLSTDVVKLLR